MYYLPGAKIFLLVLTSEENEGEGTGIGGEGQEPWPQCL